MAVASYEPAAFIDDVHALGVSGLREKIVAGQVGHTEGYYTGGQKSGQVWVPPPLAPQIAKNASKLQEIVDTMSGAVESA